MLLNLRGANGAGKTTVVRRVMAHRGQYRPIKNPDCKVIGYQCTTYPVVVFGPYETPTGGCDNFSAKGIADWICETLLEFHRMGNHVIFEGVLLSMYGFDRMTKLHADSGQALHVIELSTPLAACLYSVNERRKERAIRLQKPFEPVNPDLITDKVTAIRRNSEKLLKHGIPVEFLGREEAFYRSCELLGVSR
jgi:predicted kinase